MGTHRMEGRKREEQVGELRSVACHKQGLTHWRGGRGRSGLVSFETWHVINKDSPTGGEEREGEGEGIRKDAGGQRSINKKKGGRGRGEVGRIEKKQVQEEEVPK